MQFVPETVNPDHCKQRSGSEGLRLPGVRKTMLPFPVLQIRALQPLQVMKVEFEFNSLEFQRHKGNHKKKNPLESVESGGSL